MGRRAPRIFHGRLRPNGTKPNLDAHSERPRRGHLRIPSHATAGGVPQDVLPPPTTRTTLPDEFFDGAKRWECLAVELLDAVKRVADGDGPASSRALLASCRLVNRHWNRWATRSTTCLTPLGAPLQVVALAMKSSFTNASELRLNAYTALGEADILALAGVPQLRRLKFGRNRYFTFDRHLMPAAAYCALGALTGLEALDVGGCTNVGEDALATLTSLTSLRYLDVEQCPGVAGAGVRAIATLTGLRHLSLRRFPLYSYGREKGVSDGAVRRLAPLTMLTSLDLSGCVLLTDASLVVLAQRLRYLKRLWLERCCQVTDAGMAAVATLPQLELLNFAMSDDLPCVTNAGFGALAALTGLTVLDLSGCMCSNLAPMAAMPRLAHLDLYGAEVSDGDVRHLAGATALEHLDLTGCRLGDEGVRVLSALPRISHLDLSGGRSAISEDGLRALEGMTSLRELKLPCFNAQLTSEELSQPTALRTLASPDAEAHRGAATS
eukprot:evm.model.scf_901.2 EVM.evm.TU.scf_901.2   scf_901:10908-12392(-)